MNATLALGVPVDANVHRPAVSAMTTERVPTEVIALTAIVRPPFSKANPCFVVRSATTTL